MLEIVIPKPATEDLQKVAHEIQENMRLDTQKSLQRVECTLPNGWALAYHFWFERTDEDGDEDVYCLGVSIFGVRPPQNAEDDYRYLLLAAYPPNPFCTTDCDDALVYIDDDIETVTTVLQRVLRRAEKELLLALEYAEGIIEGTRQLPAHSL